MSYHTEDTICAIGTAPGGAARGMVRISGPDVRAVVNQVFSANEQSATRDVRRPSVIAGQLRVVMNVGPAAATPRDTERASSVPCALFFWPSRRSYTREPLAELHTIGSPPVLQAALASVCRAGARFAEPGEFTLRAFLAGRIDLTQAEAVLGVIDARGTSDLQTALNQLAGGLARPLHQSRDELLQLLSELEAGLDFVEEDIEFISRQELQARLESIRRVLEGVAQQLTSRGTTHDSPQVALVGPPNAGKSSLFNALVARFGSAENSQRTRPLPALVSPHRGTTRDYLTATVSFPRTRCTLVDTAGVDSAGGGVHEPLDFAARTVALERRRSASVRAYCIASPSYLAMRAGDLGRLAAGCDLIVFTKSDLISSPTGATTLAGATQRSGVPSVCTSSVSGRGLAELSEIVASLLHRYLMRPAGLAVAATIERCTESVRLAQLAVGEALDIVQQSAGDELVAAELRAALAELGKVVGAVYTDDLLDRIFKSFCIGK